MINCKPGQQGDDDMAWKALSDDLKWWQRGGKENVTLAYRQNFGLRPLVPGEQAFLRTGAYVTVKAYMSTVDLYQVHQYDGLFGRCDLLHHSDKDVLTAAEIASQ